MRKNKSVLLIGNLNNVHLWRWSLFLQKAGLIVAVSSLTGVNEQQFDYSRFQNFHVFSVKKKGPIFLIKLKKVINLFRLIYYINRSPYDYVNILCITFIPAFFSIFIKKKLILTCLGTDILLTYKNCYGFEKFIYHKAFKKSFAITFDADEVKSLIIHKYKHIKKNKLYKIFWGVNTGLFQTISKEGKVKLRKKYGIPEEAIVILSIRNIRPGAQIHSIIEWFNKEINSQNIYLLIRVTSSSDEAYIQICKNYAKNNKKIIFHDKSLSYDRIHTLYNMADIDFHFLKSDATPASILEGMACKNLIFASDIISSYTDLKNIYDITLTKLDSLTEKKIFNILKRKEQITEENRVRVLKFHSESVTIQKLKQLFKIE